TENVHDLLDIMDIFVMSSVNEGLSITILEAMAHGKPVIATSVGGNPEIVVHNETGLLVSPFNVAEISRAIKLLLENRNRAELMGKKGRERVEKYFNIESMVDNIEKIYLALYEHKFKN
nr:glycosyltransferase [Candidatus Dadabacteria bacterium]